MALRPAQSFFGCCSLLAGVELTCLVVLITNIFLIWVCSSDKPLQVVHLDVSPTVQVLFASWAFVGLPIVVIAGVGAYYRIESNVRMLVGYLVGSFFISLSLPISLLVMGSLCTAAIPSEVQRMGASFVCGFADTFVFMWTLIVGVFQLYVIYTVWSCAEDIALTPYPELVKYTDALRNIRIRPAGAAAPNLKGAARAGPRAPVPQGPVPQGLAGPQQGMNFGPVPTGAPVDPTWRPIPADPTWLPPPPLGDGPARTMPGNLPKSVTRASSQQEAFESNPFGPVPVGSMVGPPPPYAQATPSFLPAPPPNLDQSYGTRMMAPQPQSFVPTPASGIDFSSRRM